MLMILGVGFLLQALPGINTEPATGAWIWFFLFWAVGFPLLAYGCRAVLSTPNPKTR